MTVDQINSDASPNADSISTNGDLLEALRAEPGFSVGQYGGLDEVLEKLESSLGNFFSGFVKAEVELSLSSVAIYSDEQQFSALGGNPYFASYIDKRGEFVVCVGLKSSSFRQILRSILGSAYRSDTDKQAVELTGAESKLFQRFSNRLCSAFSRTLELRRGNCVTVQTELKYLNTLASEQELIVLTYEAAFSGSKITVSILTPLDVLEPANVPNGQGGKQTAEKLRGDRWSKKLSDKIDELEVPLVAQLAARKMYLTDVAKFQKGSRLDVEFELRNVKITDCEENNLFLADLELSDRKVVICVTGSSINTRG